MLKLFLLTQGNTGRNNNFKNSVYNNKKKNTERPETVKAGMNILTSYSLNRINNAIKKV